MTHRDRAGEPAAGELVGASESLDDVPYRPRLPCYPPGGPPGGPTHRPPDLYGSLSALLDIISPVLGPGQGGLVNLSLPIRDLQCCGAKIPLPRRIARSYVPE